MLRPAVFLIAEDHTGWDKVTQAPDVDGLGFDAVWFAEFYHNLLGTDADTWASLVARHGYGADGGLNINALAGSLAGLAIRRSYITFRTTRRETRSLPTGRWSRPCTAATTSVQPVGGRRRHRFAAGMSLLSAGTPMFLMGEEVGALEDYKYDDFLKHREDIAGLRQGAGARLYYFYQELIGFRHDNPAIRSRQIEVLYTHNNNRVLVFRRDGAQQDLLVFASLNNRPFASGYWIYSPGLPDGSWREVFNSDSVDYGGQNIGNGGGVVQSLAGYMGPAFPACGLLFSTAYKHRHQHEVDPMKK